MFFTVGFSLHKKTAGQKLDALEPSATKGVRLGLLQKLEGGAPSEASSSSITPEVQGSLHFFGIEGPWIFEIFALVLSHINSPLQDFDDKDTF